jgi:hypothetical protein
MNRFSLSSNTLAQGLHVALGSLAVSLPGWLWGTHAATIGAVSALVFAGIKEAWFDPHFETPATAGSGWEDFGFWCVGIVAAWLLRLLV